MTEIGQPRADSWCCWQAVVASLGIRISSHVLQFVGMSDWPLSARTLFEGAPVGFPSVGHPRSNRCQPHNVSKFRLHALCSKESALKTSVHVQLHNPGTLVRSPSAAVVDGVSLSMPKPPRRSKSERFLDRATLQSNRVLQWRKHACLTDRLSGGTSLRDFPFAG